MCVESSGHSQSRGTLRYADESRGVAKLETWHDEKGGDPEGSGSACTLGLEGSRLEVLEARVQRIEDLAEETKAKIKRMEKDPPRPTVSQSRSTRSSNTSHP